MTRRAYLYFILTFLLGVIVGGAGVFFYGWHWGHWQRHSERHRQPWGFVGYLAQELNLSDAQVTQLKQIMGESRGKYDAVRERVEPEFDAIRKETNSRIRQILTPEQVTKFDEMIRHFEERMKRERPHGGG